VSKRELASPQIFFEIKSWARWISRFLGRKKWRPCGKVHIIDAAVVPWEESFGEELDLHIVRIRIKSPLIGFLSDGGYEESQSFLYLSWDKEDPKENMRKRILTLLKLFRWTKVLPSSNLRWVFKLLNYFSGGGVDVVWMWCLGFFVWNCFQDSPLLPGPNRKIFSVNAFIQAHKEAGSGSQKRLLKELAAFSNPFFPTPLLPHTKPKHTAQKQFKALLGELDLDKCQGIDTTSYKLLVLSPQMIVEIVEFFRRPHPWVPHKFICLGSYQPNNTNATTNTETNTEPNTKMAWNRRDKLHP